MSLFQVNEKCNGCLACEQNCPASALQHQDRGKSRKILHNISLCARCGNCWRVCPQDAIEFHALLQGAWEKVTEMELVNCTVCGEPIYTTKLKTSLKNKTKNAIQHLCPEHKKHASLSVWKKVASGRIGDPK